MRSLCLFPGLALLCVVGPALQAADLPHPTGEAIVAPDARLELLFTRSLPIEGGLTEGPAVSKDGRIFFSDIPVGTHKGKIMVFDPKTMKVAVFAEDSHKTNGLKFDAEGRLTACEGADFGGRAITRWNIATGERTVLAEKYMGKRFNAPNDLVIDRMGRIYFSDPKYLGDEKRELEYRAVYRVDPKSGEVVEVTHEVEKPNGLALSPDGKTLYLADHNNGTDKIDPNAPRPTPGAMKIYAFPLGDDGLVSGPRKTLVDFGSEPGCDGMTVDAQGHIYITARSPRRPGVLVINPAGQEVAFLPTGPSQPLDSKEPTGLPSNVTFGLGEEKNRLYITVDKSLYRIRLKVDGYHPFFK